MALRNWKTGVWCASALGLLVASIPVRAEVQHYILRFKIGTTIVGTGEFDYDPEPTDPPPATKTGTVSFTAYRNAGGAYDLTVTIGSQHHLAEGCTPANPCPSRIRTIVGEGLGQNTVPADTNRKLIVYDNGDPNDRLGIWELRVASTGTLLRSGTTHWSDTAEPIPEPPMALLILSGAAALTWIGRRRKMSGQL